MDKQKVPNPLRNNYSNSYQYTVLTLSQKAFTEALKCPGILTTLHNDSTE